MIRLLAAVCAAALVLCGGASADSFRLFELPGSDAPNIAGGSSFPLGLSTPPAQPQVLSFEQLQPIWQSAGDQYGIPWYVLAAINKIESDFGRNMGPSSAGAVGWMQFMPSTWERWGTDADGDGVADPWNATDAIFSAARYLAAAGGSDLQRAVFAYNHAQWYVDEVLQLAQVYAGGGVEVGQGLEDLQARIDQAKDAVLAANARLLAAEQVARTLEREEDAALEKATRALTLTVRLDAQKHAVLTDGALQDARTEVEARRADLEAAQAELDAARQATSGAAFSPGAAAVVDGPAYSNGYVFPVGGGPDVVRVWRTHHDYPAADIAAPEGSPIYELSDGVVSWASAAPSGNCGIGFTVDTTDGLSWTYCHLAYLEPAVAEGAQLTAGQSVGLVGQTGHAEGPHLHLQLHPADAYPQDEPWFQSFLGTAFSWMPGEQSEPAARAVFAVVDGAPGGPDASAGDGLVPDGTSAPAAVVLFSS
ncbi:MAG TPA: lytic murein transglycosylase [Gaiellaceae bacterium]